MAFTSTDYQYPATSRVGIKESVLDLIALAGADETPLLNKISKTPVNSITHSWITDRLGEGIRRPRTELEEFSDDAKSTKQKTTNSVEILSTELMISKTMQNVATYGGKELEYETKKRAKEHQLSQERMLWGLDRDSDQKKSIFMPPVYRTETIAAKSAGLFYFLAKGSASFSDGLRGNIMACDSNGDLSGENQVLDWDMLHTILERVYNAGERPKDIFVGAGLKKAFNNLVTRQLGNDTKGVNVIKSIETDFGAVNIHLSRHLRGDLDDTFVAGNFDYMKLGLLVPTNLEEVPTSKTAKAYRYYTEATAIVNNADAFVAGMGLKA
jgi:hypothetical protein